MKRLSRKKLDLILFMSWLLIVIILLTLISRENESSTAPYKNHPGVNGVIISPEPVSPAIHTWTERSV